jgi:outer membrane protein assembly factor BamD (BamD/ComL family)
MNSFRSNLKRYAPVLFCGLILFVSACQSGPRDIPPDLSPEELIQRAQEAADKSRYTAALRYYETIRERYPTNMDLVCMVEYEIAFIHYKQKKYDEARAGFTALLERYEERDAELMPQQFKKLARKVLEQIEEKEKPRRFFGKTDQS